ncbi:MAG: peptidylprolyl isomerase [Acidobacteria bacterium]|nr:peptidylprolyl isomerase [Acidobacteriota bacterium]
MGLAALLLLVATAAGAPRAEIIEEIAARVNDSIIVRSEVQERRAALVRQIEEEVPPKEREETLARAQEDVLFDMINQELLVQRARLQFDMDKYFDNLQKDFMRKNEISTHAELDLFLKNSGLTSDEFRRLLLRSNVPQDVLQFDVARKLVVTPEQIQTYYDENLNRFLLPGEVSLGEIVILAEPRGREEARTLALDAVARVRVGEPFDEVARELSEAPSKDKGGSVGPFETGDLAPILEEKAFSLPLGTVSEPIETSYGFHILTVISRTAAGVASLADVKDQVERTLRQEKYGEDLDRYLGKLWADNQVVVTPRYATGKLVDGGPYATLEELLVGDIPLGPRPEDQNGEETGNSSELQPAADEPTPDAASPAEDTAPDTEAPAGDAAPDAEAPPGDAVPPGEGPET